VSACSCYMIYVTFTSRRVYLMRISYIRSIPYCIVDYEKATTDQSGSLISFHFLFDTEI
jgi:hypothetical protein